MNNYLKYSIIFILSAFLIGISFFYFQKQILINESRDIFVNHIYNVEFRVPKGYLIMAMEYMGTDDPAKAVAFVFRKKSESYDGVPILEFVNKSKLTPNQSFKDYVEYVYNLNKVNNKTTTNIKTKNYGNLESYEFGLNSGFYDQGGSRSFDSSGGKVVFLYHDTKIIRLLFSGYDSGLEKIFDSMVFR